MNLRRMRDVLLGVLLLAAAAFALRWALDLPTVYRDSLTGACVRVETKHGQGSCSALPEHYNNVWR